MKLEFSRQIFEKYSNIVSNENLSSGSRAIPCGQTDRHVEANIAFRNFANAPKNLYFNRNIYGYCEADGRSVQTT